MSEAYKYALSLLRQVDNMQWYVVPLLVFTLYIYITEIEKKNYNTIYLGLILFFLELIFEIGNALMPRILHTDPLWIIGGRPAYLIYTGYSIEIAFFFLTAGILIVKALPENPRKRILFIPGWITVPVIMGLTGVLVETLLNFSKILIWEHRFWQYPHLYLLAVGYVAPWLFISWLHYNKNIKVKKGLALLFSLTALFLHSLFVSFLHWI
jgi:hypothetical protein